ncbi:hypothetical protein [Bacillus sp. AFS096315]|uniref:hypothetical protein n=1 Tax=Bacillus sp. AFS096315 TaxID=2033517 RepID=UPI000BED79B2|nr:hypothetical protein [Bacillus sp. AFS096315]PEC46378.1 hypothetical protein CON00_23950 [Bacillus sp. AFS096315]
MSAHFNVKEFAQQKFERLKTLLKGKVRLIEYQEFVFRNEEERFSIYISDNEMGRTMIIFKKDNWYIKRDSRTSESLLSLVEEVMSCNQSSDYTADYQFEGLVSF